jgi:hypothetical protein
MALLLVNLGLLYAFSSRLSGSREVGALAALLGAYHAHLADLYYSTGTIYDLLCFAFYFAFLTWYIAIRERGQTPRWWQAAALLLLFVAAMGSKEMAATLPLFVLLYELLYHPPDLAPRALLKWATVQLWFVWFAGLLTLAEMVHKFTGKDAMAKNPSYTPHFTWPALKAAWDHYLFDLFYGRIHFDHVNVLLVWAAVAVAALALRRRAAVFAALMALFGMAPVAFIVPRGFFAIYISLPGWYLLAALLLVGVRDAVVRVGARPIPGIDFAPRQAALFAVVAAALIPLHERQKPRGNSWVAEGYKWVRSIEVPLSKSHEPFPHAARVLFLDDPYPVDDWIQTFIFRLHTNDGDVKVDRVKTMPAPPDAARLATYDRVYFMGKNWRLIRVR